ncbi:hypothetical protein HOLleu_00492 [Holothuria leucospilota]|uniref:Uncharacterized protein n=1 Tax=Holothuria leucospilota TaxID=206669 RepID=A0A9Q1CPH8_HOLLE|nr:hypothetical protein HOLleu_00492 [Holothuria leucospilota]
MQRWRKQQPYLQVLARGSPKQRQGIIHGASKELINCLCEGALNTLKGNVPLKKQQKKRLTQHRRQLRQLASRRVSQQSKKKILLQKGGSLLGALLPPLIGVLGSVLLSKK